MTDSQTTEKPLLAYSVLEEDEWTGGILFARSGIEARRRGANKWNGGEFSGIRVRREKWADQYAAKGKIPMGEYLARGWDVECSNCYQVISDDPFDKNGDPVVLEPCGEFDGHAFCTPKCKIEFEERVKKNVKAA